MRGLRHTSCSLGLTKDSFQSGELRKDAQISDLRHGLKKNSGDIGIEFSYGEYDELLAAAIRGDWVDNVLVAGINVPTFTIEREFADIEQFQLFTGCAVNTLSLEVQTNAMVTGTINFIGKDVNFGGATAAADTLESYTESPLDGFSGVLKEGGLEIAVITSISLQIENGITTADVLGSNTAAALVPARINCTGTVSAYFENLDLLNKFVNETESDLEITLGNGGPGSYIIKIPRLKYSGGDNPADGEGPIMLNMPFQALLDPCTGTNILIERIPLAEETAEPCVLEYVGVEFTESDVTASLFEQTISVSLSGGKGKAFNGMNGKALPGVSFANIPAGLTAEAIRTGDYTAEIQLTGTAASNQEGDSVTDASVTFSALAFKKGFCECAGDSVTNGTYAFGVTFKGTVSDTTPPTLDADAPVESPDNSTIVLTFSEEVMPGQGAITISSDSGDTRIIQVA